MGDVQPYPDMVCGPTCPGHLKMKPSPSQVINRASLVVFVCLAVQACPTLCDPMDCSLPGSSVHGILQTRIMEWEAIPRKELPAMQETQV